MPNLPKAIATATAAALRARGLKPHVVEIGPWKLRVWRGGKKGGEPWILLHGLGATSATWLPLLGRILDDCEVVIPELSANGGTEGPRAAIGVADGVGVVAELARRELPGERPTIAGVSLGGWVATKVAAAHPGLPARLVLVVPGGYRDQDWERIRAMVQVEAVRDIRAMWKALFVRPPWYLRLGRLGLYFLYTTPTVRDVLATVREEDAFDDADLARIDVPVGLVWGAGDRLFRAEVGEAMRRALPEATLTVIPDAGHGVQWERPRAFAAAIAELRRRFPVAPLRAAAPRTQDGAGG